jgi:hypothetical protein
MGLRETVNRLMKKVGHGKMWGGSVYADVVARGFFDPSRTPAARKLRAGAPGGVRRFAGAMGLRVAVFEVLNPARLRAEGGVPEYRVAAAEARAAEARSILGLADDPTDDQIDAAVLRMTKKLKLSAEEAAVVIGFRPRMEQSQPGVPNLEH